jgi:hypothetical protein
MDGGKAAIISSSIRAPSVDNWFMQMVVLAGVQDPKAPTRLAAGPGTDCLRRGTQYASVLPEPALYVGLDASPKMTVYLHCRGGRLMGRCAQAALCGNGDGWDDTNDAFVADQIGYQCPFVSVCGEEQ